MKKKLIVIGAIALIVLITAGIYFYQTANAETGRKEEIKKVTAMKQDIKIAISADAKAANSLLNLKFNGSGVIKEIPVQEGQQVKKGDVLAKLDTKNLQQLYDQAKSNYNSAIYKLNKIKNGASTGDINAKQVAIDTARTAVTDAQATYDNALALYNTGQLPEQIAVANAQTAKANEQRNYDFNLATYGLNSSQEINAKKTLDDAAGKLVSAQVTLSSRNGVAGELAKLNTAKGQLAVAEAALNAIKSIDNNDILVAEETVKQTRAAMLMAENNLNDATLKAPADGVIFYIANSIGEIASSSSSPSSSSASSASGSDSSSSAFIVLAANDKINVEASVLEDDIHKIKIGMNADVTFNALQGDTFSGIVTALSLNPYVDASGIVTYKVNVMIDNSDDKIKNGMTATVAFILQKAVGVVAVPNVAVKRVNNAPSVEIETAQGSTWTKVKTGLTDGTNVEIKQGLNAGDKVIIRKEIKK